MILKKVVTEWTGLASDIIWVLSEDLDISYNKAKAIVIASEIFDALTLVALGALIARLF